MSAPLYKRFRTRIVDIGGVPMGGNYPVRVQSMTNTNTLDTKSTVKQSIRMICPHCGPGNEGNRKPKSYPGRSQEGRV